MDPAAIRDIGILATVSEGTVFPVLPPEQKKASLGVPARMPAQAPVPEFAFANALAGRGLGQGCTCCQPVQGGTCLPDAQPASSVGCCGTNALGWTVAALWSSRMG